MPPAHHKLTILISSRPGLWRDALESFLKANPGLKIQTVVQDLHALFGCLERAAPDTLLLEADLCGENLTDTLVWIKTHYPAVNCIIVVDSASQYLKAAAVGAGKVVMKSMLHNQLKLEFFIRLREEGKQAE
jgi:DNA-binding NarL/FixJ family response regulator